MTRENISYMVDLMDQMYTMAVGEYAKDYENLIDLLKEVPNNKRINENESEDVNKPEKSILYEKIEAFRKMLQNRRISGNEAIQTFMLFASDLGFFSKEEMKEYSFAWQDGKMQGEKQNAHERICLMQGSDGTIHSINFNQMEQEHKVYDQDEFRAAIGTGKIKYENEKYQILLED